MPLAFVEEVQLEAKKKNGRLGSFVQQVNFKIKYVNKVNKE